MELTEIPQTTSLNEVNNFLSGGSMFVVRKSDGFHLMNLWDEVCVYATLQDFINAYNDEIAEIRFRNRTVNRLAIKTGSKVKDRIYAPLVFDRHHHVIGKISHTIISCDAYQIKGQEKTIGYVLVKKDGIEPVLFDSLKSYRIVDQGHGIKKLEL